MNKQSNNENSHAYPSAYQEGWHSELGLTKREYFAAMFLQGILSSYDYTINDITQSKQMSVLIAKAAILQADALLQELSIT